MVSFLQKVLLIASLLGTSVLAEAFFAPKAVPNIILSPLPSNKGETDAMNRIHRRRRGDQLLPWRGGGQPLKMTADPTTPLLFNSAPLNTSLLIYTAANGLGFLISILTKSHLHLDLIGTGAFALASIPTLLSSSLKRITLSSAAVTLWGTKLAGFLFFRALKVKHDARLDDTLSTVTGQCEC